MVMMTTRTIVVIAIAVVAVVVGILFWKLHRSSLAEGNPTRPPSESDSALAEIINSLDADMRSVEIGSWFLSRLRAQISTKVDPVRCDTFLNLADIAEAIPGANVYTKATVISKIQRLVNALFVGCKGTTTKASLLKTLDAFEDSAFKPGTGVLLTMPGYSLKSSKPLPK